ncbi:MAG: hypothetical protein IK071_03040 [Lachnospiraceae bacterium]|nr:hypothetical protein [Lachnospiraceae bacterium]
MSLLIFFFVIAIVICVVIGKPIYIYIGLSGIMLATCAAMVIIFTIALILLIFSKKKKARFVRVDSAYRSDRYKCAYYLVYEGSTDKDTLPEDSQNGGPSQAGGTEYPCIFPEEGIFRKKLYRADKDCTVFLNRRFHRVFDRYSLITTALGLTFGLGMGGLLLAMFLF